MIKVTLSKKGQICLPAILRKNLGLKEGDKLSIEEKEGKIILLPLPEHPLLQMRGKCQRKNQEKLTTLLLQERRQDRLRES